MRYEITIPGRVGEPGLAGLLHFDLGDFQEGCIVFESAFVSQRGVTAWTPLNLPKIAGGSVRGVQMVTNAVGAGPALMGGQTSGFSGVRARCTLIRDLADTIQVTVKFHSLGEDRPIQVNPFHLHLGDTVEIISGPMVYVIDEEPTLLDVLLE